MATTTIEQLATPVDIHFVQGDSFTRVLHFYTLADPEDPESAHVDEDVSGWTVTAQIRRRANSSSAIDFAVDMTDAATGYVEISITPAQAATLAESNVWDLQRDLDGTGVDIRTMMSGAVTADREVTRG